MSLSDGFGTHNLYQIRRTAFDSIYIALRLARAILLSGFQPWKICAALFAFPLASVFDFVWIRRADLGSVKFNDGQRFAVERNEFDFVGHTFTVNHDDRSNVTGFQVFRWHVLFQNHDVEFFDHGCFTRLKFEPRYLGCYAFFANVSASATALSIALLLFTVS